MVARYLDAYQRIGVRLRRRVIWTLLAFGAGAATTWTFRVEVFQFLLEPAGGELSPFPGGLPIFTAPTGMMTETIHLAIRGGLFAAAPVMVIGAYTLVRPILPRRVRKFAYIFVPASLACFVGGAAFAYFVMLPTGLRFLLNFGDGVAIPLITISEYMSLLTAMMLWMGIVFELPLAMFFASKLRLFPYRRMRRIRRFVIVGMAILAGIITPTFDVINFALMWVPMVVLYEVGLFLAWSAHPSEGNYMFLRSLARAVRWVARKIWGIATSPYRGARWIYRKLRFW